MRRCGLSTAQAGMLAMAWMSMCAMAAVASPTLFAMVSAAAFRQFAKSAHSKQLKDEWKVVLSPLLACLLSVSIVADATDCTHSTHCNDYADCMGTRIGKAWCTCEGPLHSLAPMSAPCQHTVGSCDC